MTKTLLIDNYDSFTYNLYQLLGEINGDAPKVVTNDYDWNSIDLGAFDNIVISPGPGRPERPEDFGISAIAIMEGGLPLLGVCLGHQGLCYLHGGHVDLAPEPRHGRPSQIIHDGSGLFKGIPSPFTAIRYHSLAVSEVPADFDVTARSEDGVVMAVASRTQPLWGVQFHPESICTEYGYKLIENFRDLTIASQNSGVTSHQASRASLLAPQQRRSLDPATKSAYEIHAVQLFDAPTSGDVYRALFADAVYSFWLDSNLQDDQTGRFSFMGDGTGLLSEFVTSDVSAGTVTVIRNGESASVPGSIFDYLDEQLAHRFVPKPAELPFDFNLGYSGYLGYELKAQSGGLAAYEAETPDAALLFVDRMLVYDNLDQSCWIVCLSGVDPDGRSVSADDAMAWTREVKEKLSSLPRSDPAAHRRQRSTLPVDLDSGWSQLPFTMRHSKEEYLDCIRYCLDVINQGETYEVCMTNMVQVNHPIDTLETYENLRAISPVPYGAYLQFPNLAVLSASPERFMTITMGGDVESRPMKGTRPRGETADVDEKLRADLASNEKDLSENLMIVDLMRNDLNRVCEIGSVKVSNLFEVVTYPLVHQLVSTVQGKLRSDVSGIKAVQSAFPGGSMTGAPKIRTLQIIDHLEKGPRGIYSGAIGWISLSGAVDLSIVIRTIVVRNGVSSFGTGGAIVALSDPEDEYFETLVKSRAMLSALTSE